MTNNKPVSNTSTKLTGEEAEEEPKETTIAKESSIPSDSEEILSSLDRQPENNEKPSALPLPLSGRLSSTNGSGSSSSSSSHNDYLPSVPGAFAISNPLSEHERTEVAALRLARTLEEGTVHSSIPTSPLTVEASIETEEGLARVLLVCIANAETVEDDNERTSSVSARRKQNKGRIQRCSTEFLVLLLLLLVVLVVALFKTHMCHETI
jgi:hypothetical protein